MPHEPGGVGETPPDPSLCTHLGGGTVSGLGDSGDAHAVAVQQLLGVQQDGLVTELQVQLQEEEEEDEGR